eukprot:scaffold30193_cov16-Tisochrysis_lutea.AAC.1
MSVKKYKLCRLRTLDLHPVVEGTHWLKRAVSPLHQRDKEQGYYHKPWHITAKNTIIFIVATHSTAISMKCRIKVSFTNIILEPPNLNVAEPCVQLIEHHAPSRGEHTCSSSPSGCAATGGTAAQRPCTEQQERVLAVAQGALRGLALGALCRLCRLSRVCWTRGRASGKGPIDLITDPPLTALMFAASTASALSIRVRLFGAASDCTGRRDPTGDFGTRFESTFESPSGVGGLDLLCMGLLKQLHIALVVKHGRPKHAQAALTEVIEGWQAAAAAAVA